MATYQIIHLPKFLNRRDFSDLSYAEAEKYFLWFREQEEGRIAYLKGQIQLYDKSWDMDFSPSSLEVVDSWFREVVNWRLRTEFEVNKIDAQLREMPKLSVGISPQTITADEKTVSIAFDTGLYFAKCLQKSCESVFWKIVEKPKSNLDIHQPVLADPKSNIELNPRRIMEVCASKYIKGNYDKSIPQLYDIWKNILCSSQVGSAKKVNNVDL